MASSSVKLVAQTLGNLLMKEVGRLYYVKTKIESLNTELEWMHIYLADVECLPGHNQPEVERKKATTVRDLAYEAEDIVEMYILEVSYPQEDGIWNTFKWFCFMMHNGDCWRLHKLNSSIDKLTGRITEFNKRVNAYCKQGTHSATNSEIRNDARRSYPTDVEVVGLNEDVDAVVDKLLDKNNIVVITGLGGLGKTTLAKKVFSNERIKEHFKGSWVYVSRDVHRKKIFAAILRGLCDSEGDRKEVKGFEVEELQEKISVKLKSRKCLVALDDMWTTEAWGNLKPAFVKIGEKGSERKLNLIEHYRMERERL